MNRRAGVQRRSHSCYAEVFMAGDTHAHEDSSRAFGLDWKVSDIISNRAAIPRTRDSLGR